MANIVVNRLDGAREVYGPYQATFEPESPGSKMGKWTITVRDLVVDLDKAVSIQWEILQD